MALQQMQSFSHAVLIMDPFSFPPQLQLCILLYLVFLTNNIPSYTPRSKVLDVHCCVHANSLNCHGQTLCSFPNLVFLFFVVILCLLGNVTNHT